MLIVGRFNGLFIDSREIMYYNDDYPLKHDISKKILPL